MPEGSNCRTETVKANVSNGRLEICDRLLNLRAFHGDGDGGPRAGERGKRVNESRLLGAEMRQQEEKSRARMGRVFDYESRSKGVAKAKPSKGRE